MIQAPPLVKGMIILFINSNRYARTDECGIPFAITVDFETIQDKSVTLRDLDTMK